MPDDQAIVLRAWDWSETSQTASLLSRQHGVLRVLAKGARRPRGAFSGGLEPLCRGELAFITRPASDLALLTHWDLTETFPILRRRLDAHYAALYLAELVGLALADSDPHPAAFDALLEALRAMQDAPGLVLPLARFQWALLVDAGYRPVLDQPAEIAGAAGPIRALVFDPHAGGLTRLITSPSARTGPRDVITPSARTPTGDWRLRTSTVEALRWLADDHDATPSTPGTPGTPGTPDTPDTPDTPAGFTAPTPVSPEVAAVERASRFLAAYWRFILGREPLTLRLVFPDLAWKPPASPAASPGRTSPD